jgi:hypothetical protein
MHPHLQHSLPRTTQTPPPPCHYPLFQTCFFARADVSEDDIKLVMEQAQVSRAQAIKALQEHGYALSYPPP